MDILEFKKEILPIRDKMYRFALRMVHDSMEAEDIVQDVLIKLWNNKEHLESIDNLEAWCMRVTKNQTIDKLRSAHHKRMNPIPEGMDWRANSANPEEQTETSDIMTRIKEILDTLPEAQKMVMQLRDIEEMSYKEIAESLDISMEQVKVYLYRARQKVREALIKLKKFESK